MSLLKEKTHALVEDLLDEQMKSEIMQFLWWVEYADSIRAFQDFLDFLSVSAVQEILKEIDSGLYDDVIRIAEDGREQAVV
jgi:hypothetical protein